MCLNEFGFVCLVLVSTGINSFEYGMATKWCMTSYLLTSGNCYKVQFCAFKGDTQNLLLKRVGRGRSLPLKRVGRGEISPLAVPRG
jgi:hypothetical protein